jgi:glycosyltransferase involved in cell wall biosynthesis
MANPQLSIVLACYNEASHLEKSFSRLKDILSYANFTFEVIFVDDKSTDNTLQIINNIINKHPYMQMRCIVHDENTGRGRAVTDGFKAAGADIVGYIDVDLEIDAVYLYSFYRAIREGYDAGIGERVSRLSPHSITRIFTGRTYNMLMRMFIDLPLHDTESGIKFFNRHKLLTIIDSIEDRHWFWDTEICARMYKAGYTIKEIPCIYARNKHKKSTVKIVRDSIYYFKKLIQFRSVYKSL